MTLLEEVESNRKSIRTDGYPMSIGELASMYEDGELDLHPEFQRVYRWTDEQKTGLIESLLLGIPIPSIFVHQRRDGIWDVVDGLQRLSSIFQTMGILKDEQNKTLPPLNLTSTKYLPSLEGKLWGTNEADPSGLGGELQRIIKRSKMDVKIVLRESDDDTKLELFQRLNTGGSPLTRQELRNCLILLYAPKSLSWLQELSAYPAFQECIALSDKAREEQYDTELVVRFLTLRKFDPNTSIRDLGIFLDDQILSLFGSKTFDQSHEEAVFKRTFDLLASSLEDRSFRRFDVQKDRFGGGFLVSVYEVVAMGLGYYLDDLEYAPSIDLKSIPSRVWNDGGSSIGSGVNAVRRLRATLHMGRDLFAP